MPSLAHANAGDRLRSVFDSQSSRPFGVNSQRVQMDPSLSWRMSFAHAIAALDFPSERSAQDAANVAATLKQAGWRVDQGELEKAVGFTLEREEEAPQMPPFGLARAKASFKTAPGAFKTAPRDSDGQPAPKTENALVEALEALFESELAKAAAEAVKKEEKQDEE